MEDGGDTCAARACDPAGMVAGCKYQSFSGISSGESLMYPNCTSSLMADGVDEVGEAEAEDADEVEAADADEMVGDDSAEWGANSV